ncbi:MAG: hypothetical protein LBT88_00860 [Oscillospiraceae bacterium]|jgi:acyl-ACP thioesterase|nr:hypothetical protein [Oscillospiraceae bacterium]
MIIERTEAATGSRIGADGLMTEIAMLDILQDTEAIGARSDLDFWGFFDRTDCMMVIVARYVQFLNRPKYGEKLLCRTMPYANSVRYGSRYAELLDGEGNRLACGWLTALYVNWRTLKPVRVPQNLVDGVELYTPPVWKDWDRRVSAEPSLLTERGRFNVKRFDLDMFGHMNNVRHIEHAFDYLPEDAHPKALRIEYKNAAPPNAVVKAKTAVVNGKTYVLLESAGGEIYSVTEFTL